MTYETIGDAVTMQGSAEATLLAGRFRVVRQLGQGGMGSVWLAEDTQLDNKQFAIKMLPSVLVSNKRAYRQLKDEALVAMRLTHSNIVTLRAFEENNGNPFLVMDYIDGETLDDCLADKRKLSEEETISVLLPIAAALDYAHSKGVVHRDIKPGNVMIAKDGTPYILDFGIAREIQETMTRVTGKNSSGTLMYMSPEQLHGAAPKAAQDVYSFATMVYECLTGAPPFSSGEIAYRIEHDDPAPLPEAFSIAKAVMSGLAKKPEGRPGECCAILGSPGMQMAPGPIPTGALPERVVPLGAHSDKQDVAERLRQSAQAILEVDNLLAAVTKFEDSCGDPRLHSSKMAIKSARGEMESASIARCMELLEAAKVIFAEAESIHKGHVAKKHLTNAILELGLSIRNRRELSDDPGVKDCLREVEQFKMEVAKASTDECKKLQEMLPALREKVEAVVRSAQESLREREERRRLEEEARRQQEELKKRQELEERKRREQAEIESCMAKIEAVKQEIRDERDKVAAYVKENPEYGDCLQVAKEIVMSVYEEVPTDLAGVCERLKKLESSLERIRSLISSHDVVVCATLNGAEVGRASMLYGERRIELPVRIKRRDRLTKKEGYLLEYSRGNRKYYGWFSPACAKTSEGQCAMVPLYNEPSISEISRAYRKMHLMRFLWDVFVALVISLEVSVLVGLFASVCFKGKVWAAVVCGIASFVLEFRSLYCRSMRREMRCAVCDDGQYGMSPQSAFNESALLLDRKERPTSELIKKFKLRNWARCFWRLIVALYFALHNGLLIFVLVGACTKKPVVAFFLCGLPALLVTFALLCKRTMRREKWGILIGLDNYRAKRVETTTAEEAKGNPAEEYLDRTRKPHRHYILWAVVGCIIVVGGICRWQYVNARMVAAEELRMRIAKEQEAQRVAKEKEKKERQKAEIKRRTERLRQQRAEEDRKAEESKMLARQQERIDSQVESAERNALDAQKYRSDPTGLGTHLSTIDDAMAELEKMQKPKTIAEAERALESVNAVAETISSELRWLKDNVPRRDAARRIESEIKSTLDAELVRFEANAVAQEKYSSGQKLRQSGNIALGYGDFARAQNDLSAAKSMLTDALSDAKAVAKRKQEQERRLAEAYCKAEQARWVEEVKRWAEEKRKAEEAKKAESEKRASAVQPPQRRTISLEGRSSEKFRSEDADTISYLKFPSALARTHYENACEFAKKGASKRGMAQAEYNKGRMCGGPKWPELEAWLEWWK